MSEFQLTAEPTEPNAERALVSRAEYARRRGCSHTAVNKAVKAGKIPLAPGTDLIDPAVADLAWAMNRDQAQKSAIAGDGPHTRAASPIAMPALSVVPQEGTRAEAELRKEQAKATLAEIQVQRAKGEVVEVADVQQALSELVMTVKARMLGIPGKLGLRFGLAAQRLAEDEIRTALEELSEYRPEAAA
jgi:phage terminase Nu1 subunit (DNA packaging protein)